MLKVKTLLVKTFVILSALFPMVSVAADTPPSLQSWEQENIDVFKTVSPLVVNVHNIQKRMGNFFDIYDMQAGSGSGFIWDKEGHIVTNFHVIQQAKQSVISLQNGRTAPVRIIGYEPRKDIAVLKLVNDADIRELQSLSLLTIADSAALQVGQKTIAIGNPFGLERTMTTGIISALNRRIPGVGGVSIGDMIQTDASINPGNSGGPLLNSRGQLIGMNTVIFSNSGTSTGVGFALPSNEIKRTVEQIIRHGRASQVGIGVQVLGNAITKQLGIQGIVIGEVIPNSPAAKAGLQGTYRDAWGQLHWGDVIIAVDQQPVKNYDELYTLMATKTVGQTVQLTIERAGKTQSISLPTMDISTL